MVMKYLHFLTFRLFQESAHTCTHAHVEGWSWMCSTIPFIPSFKLCLVQSDCTQWYDAEAFCGEHSNPIKSLAGMHNLQPCINPGSHRNLNLTCTAWEIAALAKPKQLEKAQVLTSLCFRPLQLQLKEFYPEPAIWYIFIILIERDDALAIKFHTCWWVWCCCSC